MEEVSSNLRLILVSRGGHDRVVVAPRAGDRLLIHIYRLTAFILRAHLFLILVQNIIEIGLSGSSLILLRATRHQLLGPGGLLPIGRRLWDPWIVMLFVHRRVHLRVQTFLLSEVLRFSCSVHFNGLILSLSALVVLCPVLPRHHVFALVAVSWLASSCSHISIVLHVPGGWVLPLPMVSNVADRQKVVPLHRLVIRLCAVCVTLRRYHKIAWVS